MNLYLKIALGFLILLVILALIYGKKEIDDSNATDISLSDDDTSTDD
ncbi:hypothetical protein PAENIP36_21860 [Paenibacillus sp. P36]